MQTRLDLPGLRPLLPGAGQAVADPRQAAFQRTLAPLVGQSVKGEVLAKLSDGSYLVRVADTNARMMLPGGTQVGVDVPLNVVAAQPRPLLQVGTGQAQPATVYTPPGEADAPAAALPQGAPAAGAQARPMSAAAVLLNSAPLVAADQLPTLDRSAAQATLSPAARAIASALTQAYTAPGAPVTIHGKGPLVAAGAPDPAKLESALKNVLGESGLFYESHVADWAEGKRSLQDLAREPQMQRMTAPNQGASTESLAKAMAGPDLSAAQMINLQLHTQEQGKVQWHGEAWPGQRMEWEVAREDSEGRSRGGGRDTPDEQPVWRSGVRFRFPLLGQVNASVTLVGDQVQIQMQAGSDDTAATLKAWSGALQGALEAAGMPLSSLSIGLQPDAAAKGADAS
ncbi:flagellar hook-length control protein FliK [Pseudoduganella lurida]|uniref:Flagellar hook-length control protein FliK n=1 Tax=Pseudoduganella lurida TaxID=1036180 RepID=A0A562R6B8_9BURK|nr:flagellar hook-length control protein FliK [Pseudoduganella lurida]TWI64601.1 flagellar hook-length control protein FliK [Pseudoduganella lurida]